MYEHNRVTHQHLVHERQNLLRQEAADERLSRQARAGRTTATRAALSCVTALMAHLHAMPARLHARLARRYAASKAPQP